MVFLCYAIGWTTFFLCFHYSLVYILKMEFMSKWCQNMGTKKQDELPGYISSLVHHFGISPICLISIIRDYFAYNNSAGIAFDMNHYTAMYAPSGLFPFTVGYFVADCITFALPEAYKKPGFSSKVFLIHHCVALSMIYATYTMGSGSLSQVFPGMMCTELSTIFFNIAWIMRAFGFREYKIVTLFESLFAFFFLLLRNLHLTILIYLLWYDIAGFGVYQCSIVISTALQFFWGYKIIMSLISSSQNKKKKSV